MRRGEQWASGTATCELIRVLPSSALAKWDRSDTPPDWTARSEELAVVSLMVAEGRVGGAPLQGNVDAVQNGQRVLVLLAGRLFSFVLVVVQLPRGGVKGELGGRLRGPD